MEEEDGEGEVEALVRLFNDHRLGEHHENYVHSVRYESSISVPFGWQVKTLRREELRHVRSQPVDVVHQQHTEAKRRIVAELERDDLRNNCDGVEATIAGEKFASGRSSGGSRFNHFIKLYNLKPQQTIL